jgi:hypothetical protein
MWYGRGMVPPRTIAPHQSAASVQQGTQPNYSGEYSMKTTLIGIAFVATASLFGLSAHAANCSDPIVGSQQRIPVILNHAHFAPHEGIVGTWLVTYPNGQAYIQWHSDGTEWENINMPTITGNICMGSWESKGPWTYSRNHFGWLFDTSGNNVGYFNETETDTLAKDGNSYSGTNVTIFYDTSGNVIPAPGTMGPPPTGGYPGTSSATRIEP